MSARSSSDGYVSISEIRRKILESDEFKDLFKTTPVVVNGFLILSRLPSKALLDAHIPEIFKNVAIGKKVIKLVMGYFYNKLGSLSRKYYAYILPKYAVYAGFGYILPFNMVERFLKEVEDLKKEYAEYEKQLKEFLLTGNIPPELRFNSRVRIHEEYLDIIREYLKKQGKEHVIREKIEKLNIADRVDIRLLPLALDISILEDYLDKKVLDKIEKELDKTKKEIFENAKKQINEKIEAIIKKLERYANEEVSKMWLKRLDEELADIENFAYSMGIYVSGVSMVRSWINKGPSRFVMELKRQKMSGRLRALLTVMS